MAVELFASIDKSKVDMLPFITGAYPFGYKDSSYTSRLGIVYEISAESAKKIKKILKGKVNKNIEKKDRVFVLSGCKIPQFKIKEFCRGVGAIMVNEIEEATVVVGNDRVAVAHNDYNTSSLNSLSLLLDSNYRDAEKVDFYKFRIDDVLKEYHPDLDKIKNVRFNRAACHNHGDYIVGKDRYMHAMTPYLARAIYEILSRKLPIITEDCLYKQLPSIIKLDKEVYHQIMTMMNSSDEENQKTAHEILANCDYTDSELYLYAIARGYWYQISRSRFKNVKLFREEAKLQRLYKQDEEKYLTRKANENKLTVEMLNLILPTIAEKLKTEIDHITSSIFTLKMELKPEFANILGEHQFNKKVKSNKNTEENDF